MKFSTVILAAGKGRRMNSALPKVLHTVGGRPMLAFVVGLAQELKSKNTVIVVPPDNQLIRDTITTTAGKSLHYAVQAVPRGTGDAVRSALGAVSVGANDTVLVLNGDMPLIEKATVTTLLRQHTQRKAAMSFLSVLKEDPSGFGRIRRDENFRVQGIVEEKDASPAEKKIIEVNVGVYAFHFSFLKAALKTLQNKNAQKEFYLTDLVAMALRKNLPLHVMATSDVGQTVGANSVAELAAVNQVYYARRREKLTQTGVVLMGNDIFVDADVKIAPGVRLESPCYVKGFSVIEADAVIETGCVIRASLIKKQAQLKAHCYIDASTVGAACHVGPFAHLRPHTHLQDGVKVGNFVEIKKSIIGQSSKINHLSYIGDAVLGKSVNVGAGTITCNYDGVNKNATVIGDGVFIGSDSQLVAPVTIGRGAYVGAGTTVTRNVPPDSLVISRVRQREIPGWAKRRQKKTPAAVKPRRS